MNERASIIDDVFFLVNNDKLSISFAFNILEYLPEEENYLPWKFAIKNLRKIIRNIEDDSPTYSKFRVRFKKISKNTNFDAL